MKARVALAVPVLAFVDDHVELALVERRVKLGDGRTIDAATLARELAT